MPTIYELYGIRFVIHVRGEHPPPHVHVKYNEHEAVIEIESAKITEGYLPRTAARLAKKWVGRNHRELMREWERMEKGETPQFISTTPKGA